jgi:hypothetical protein
MDRDLYVVRSVARGVVSLRAMFEAENAEGCYLLTEYEASTAE